MALGSWGPRRGKKDYKTPQPSGPSRGTKELQASNEQQNSKFNSQHYQNNDKLSLLLTIVVVVVSGTQLYDCVAPYVDIILHRGRSRVKSAASGSVRCCFRSRWTVLSHVMRGRPGCLLQSAGGAANRISRHDWIIALSLGCFVSLRTSSQCCRQIHAHSKGLSCSNTPALMGGLLELVQIEGSWVSVHHHGWVSVHQSLYHLQQQKHQQPTSHYLLQGRDEQDTLITDCQWNTDKYCDCAKERTIRYNLHCNKGFTAIHSWN